MTEPQQQQQQPSLFEAITQGPAAVISALLAGADKNAKNDQGQTASEVAPSNDIASIVQSWPEKAFDVPQALTVANTRLADIAANKERSTKACEEWVKAVTERRDARVAELLRLVQEAESEAALNIEQAEQTRNLEVEALNRTEEAVQELARGLKTRSNEFQLRASKNLTALTEPEVVALFRAIRIDIDENKLKGITGEILAEIQEGDVEPYLGIRALGPRRRLMGSIRKLKQHNPFSDLHVPSTTIAKEGDALPAIPYTWNVSQVVEWLRKEGLCDLIELFRGEEITGDVLMDITGADLRTMGVQQLGPRIMCERKIAELRKPFVEPNVDAPMSAEQVQTILRQHNDVEKQLAELSERNSARLIGDTRAVPTDFLCPITRGIMEDPVIACDTLTYERVAIEAWFIEHETSPITRQVIQKTLIPNAALRRMITQFIDDRPL